MTPQYYFNNHLRWSYYWENPNHWALFVVYLLIGIWFAGVFTPKLKSPAVRVSAKIILYILEIGLWFLLVKTYSRGGLVAACAALVFFFALNCRQWRGRAASIVVRIFCVATLCLALGASQRMATAYMAQDKSVTNRLQTWQGALVMVHDSPTQGWGNGNGGLNYINWYQPHVAQERPTGFTNSFLEIAVEQGLVVFGGALVISLLALALSVRGRRNPVNLLGGACIVAWAVANLWSSLWPVPALWLVPAASIIAILAINLRSYKSTLRTLLPAAALAGVSLTAILYGLGAYFAPRYAWKVVPNPQADQLLMVKRTQKNAMPRHALWVDAAVWGRFYGKTIRSHAEAAGVDALMIIPPWARRDVVPDAGMTHVFSGFHAARIKVGGAFCSLHGEQDAPPALKTILLHPTVYPPNNKGHNLRMQLFLPQYDYSAYRLPWKTWARNHDVPIHHTPQGGQLISPLKNDALLKILQNDF